MDQQGLAEDQRSIRSAPSNQEKSLDAGVKVHGRDLQAGDEGFEVFKDREGEISYRTVGWIRATFIFFKVLFATGVLAIPSAMAALGGVGGSLLIVASGLLNTYCTLILGNFRNKHPGCHTIADMAEYVGGVWLRELVGVLYIIAMVLVSGGGIIGVQVGLNLLSNNAICSVLFSLIAAIVIGMMASFPKFHQIGWLTWAGSISIFVAVFIVVVGVTQQDRPRAAPAGPYELGFYAVPPKSPPFILGLTSTINIWSSSAGYPAFIPVMSEMKRPKDFSKAVIACMTAVTTSYLVFSLVVYRWCGQYVSTPSLSSAGDTIAKISYGIGILGLLASSMIYIHVGAKYLFVRILRDSRHLQAKTVIHWCTWLGCSIGLTLVAWVCSEGIPIFNYVVSLSGALCWGPMALILPPVFFFYDYWHYIRGDIKQKSLFFVNCVIAGIGAFFTVGGVYASVQSIVDAYADGTIGRAFNCESNTVNL